jgi:uncharacterized membrane protein
MKKNHIPTPSTSKWIADDCSASAKDVERLEEKFGFKMRAMIGLLNYLANTSHEELYAIRKACKYMHIPGGKHFKAVQHLLHHIQCYPPKAIR